MSSQTRVELSTPRDGSFQVRREPVTSALRSAPTVASGWADCPGQALPAQGWTGRAFSPTPAPPSPPAR